MTGLRGQAWDTGAWAAFGYTLEEPTASQQVANTMKGTNTMTFKKIDDDWQVVLVHAAVNGPGKVSPPPAHFEAWSGGG